MTLDEAALAARYDFAIQLARQAGAIAKRYFRSSGDIGVTTKGPQDFLTLADSEVDVFISTSIKARFAEDAVLTEESGGAAGQFLWVIDPIDGTANFARGIASFAISIAFCVQGVAQIGVVYDPVADEMFAARRGGGAFCNGVPILVRRQVAPENAAVDVGYSRRTSSSDYLALVGRLQDEGYDVMQFGSAARGLAMVSAGRLDGFFEADLYAWDVLAGLLLVEEAGGYAGEFSVEEGWKKGGAVLACTGVLKASLTAAIGKMR